MASPGVSATTAALERSRPPAASASLKCPWRTLAPRRAESEIHLSHPAHSSQAQLTAARVQSKKRSLWRRRLATHLRSAVSPAVQSRHADSEEVMSALQPARRWRQGITTARPVLVVREPISPRLEPRVAAWNQAA